MVTKLFSIFISSIILVQSFNIHIADVLKLDELMEHAKMHKNKYDDNFLVFLSKHYGDLKQSHKQQQQEEEKDHSHLPINHECSSHIQASFIIDIISFSIDIPCAAESSINYYYQDKFSSFEEQEIFQPPQLA